MARLSRFMGRVGLRRILSRFWRCAVFAPVLLLLTAAADVPSTTRHAISELTPVARIHLGKTADWVAISDDIVWVGTTGPDGVVAIDPHSNTVAAAVALPGEPCAGLALGFGGVWVPLCAKAKPNALARVDLRTHGVTLVPAVGPADREGGITVSSDSVWLVIDERATLVRVDPGSLRIRQKIALPSGSLNPTYSDGFLWVTRPTGAQVTVLDSGRGRIVGTVPTGPNPRFLDAGQGSVWTLNQGDGTLTRINAQSKRADGAVSLRTPGHGGDIKLAHGIVWTTMVKVPLSATDATTGRVLCQWFGPGGDSLGVSREAIWLTDYAGGDVYRYELKDVLAHCPAIGTR
jgi:virginiamycin B lyase